MSKLACITLDFEQDYGWRVQQFNILGDNQAELTELGALFHSLNLPVSAFVVTHLLQDYPAVPDLLPRLAVDFHGHSHSHNTREFHSRREIETMQAAFQAHFGYAPLGYRAPLGVLRPGDIDLLADYGFKFSSSVFPSWRLGKFNHLGSPRSPFYYPNGLLELPLATVNRARVIVSLSYLKLLGWRANYGLFETFGLPEVVIFNTHLHDFIWNPQSYGQLPAHYQLAWGRNRQQSGAYFEKMVHYLRRKGYHFITMTELYEQMAAKLR
jgi:peptidoglycan/xylan/chitin deacetylase (PgdA/CDA1 family)